jgi:phosphatidylinositol-3,4,5-trisphosphate 3-phosphatase/dual-specificity protein phosphatase PTEN
MHTLTDEKWGEFRDNLGQRTTRETSAPGETSLPLSETNSMYDVTQSAKERGVVLDADREVRMKLYMGQVSRSLLPLF